MRSSVVGDEKAGSIQDFLLHLLDYAFLPEANIDEKQEHSKDVYELTATVTKNLGKRQDPRS